MPRTQPWTVVLLLAVTGLAVGFTRLDAVRRTPAPTSAVVVSPVRDTTAEDSKKLREFLDEFVRFLDENESEVPFVTLPPLQEWPLLPNDLLPEPTTTAGLSAEPI